VHKKFWNPTHGSGILQIQTVASHLVLAVFNWNNFQVGKGTLSPLRLVSRTLLSFECRDKRGQGPLPNLKIVPVENFEGVTLQGLASRRAFKTS
jgi:hypothetical protein